MKTMNDRTQLGQPRPTLSPTRFRIEKLEDPGTQKCASTVGRPTLPCD